MYPEISWAQTIAIGAIAFGMICLALLPILLAARAAFRALLDAYEERDREVERPKEAREFCNGSCDIALARRQVGPDGIVPRNARECAELWEAEAARLRQQLAEAQVEQAHAEALIEDWNLTTETSATTKLLRLKLSKMKAQLAALRELLREISQHPNSEHMGRLTAAIRAAVAAPMDESNGLR